MLKDKQKDMIRAILPSTARTYARQKGRYIARARRRAVREALNMLSPEDEWDDSNMFEHVSPRLSRLRSDECWRISERRGADKLGPLRRFTEHQKRTSENDDEAYEKICQVLQPGKNLITRHAALHAEFWLDLEKDKYRYSWNSYKYRRPPSVIRAEDVERIIAALYELAHRKLNKIFKDGGLKVRRCTKDHPCHVEDIYTHVYLESYGEFTDRWYIIPTYYEWSRLSGKKRRRKVERRYERHDWRRCPNKLIIRSREDLPDVVKGLRFGYSQKEWDKLSPSEPIKRLLRLAEKYNVLPTGLKELANA